MSIIFRFTSTEQTLQINLLLRSIQLKKHLQPILPFQRKPPKIPLQTPTILRRPNPIPKTLTLAKPRRQIIRLLILALFILTEIKIRTARIETLVRGDEQHGFRAGGTADDVVV